MWCSFLPVLMSRSKNSGAAIALAGQFQHEQTVDAVERACIEQASKRAVKSIRPKQRMLLAALCSWGDSGLDMDLMGEVHTQLGRSHTLPSQVVKTVRARVREQVLAAF